jgi:hypothetical protein
MLAYRPACQGLSVAAPNWLTLVVRHDGLFDLFNHNRAASVGTNYAGQERG